MITPEYCINYVKKRLGVPFTPFEISDSDLFFWLENAVREFSSKIPRKELLLLNVDDPSVKTEEENVFYIPTSSKIINVMNVYTTLNNLFISGHPYAVWPVKDLAYQSSFYGNTELSVLANKNSMLYFTYEYLPPSKIRITPVLAKTYNVELEVAHSLDLSTVFGEWETVFLKLYLKTVARVLATIRSTYRTYGTPIGDIELNPEGLETLADKIEEELKEIFDNVNPGVIVVRG